MSRYLVTISYLGTDYSGWQVQSGTRTVQSEICCALKKFLGKKTDATGCSRTDSGVHAEKFCFHFDTDKDITCNDTINALNFYLPEDIRVTNCITVPDDFHARYSAKGKRYIYKIKNSDVFSPFLIGRACFIKYKLDFEKMKSAADYFVGEYDFSAFCASGTSVIDKVRTITECKVIVDGDMIEISVAANGFLYNMVRIIAGTLIDVGCGKISPDSIPDIINSCNRNNAGKTAPPEGLYLKDVFY